jgi:hypothetical protein
MEEEKLIDHQKDLMNAKATDIVYHPQHEKDSTYNKKLAEIWAWAATSGIQITAINIYLTYTSAGSTFLIQRYYNSLGRRD